MFVLLILKLRTVFIFSLMMITLSCISSRQTLCIHEIPFCEMHTWESTSEREYEGKSYSLAFVNCNCMPSEVSSIVYHNNDLWIMFSLIFISHLACFTPCCLKLICVSKLIVQLYFSWGLISAARRSWIFLKNYF